MNRVVGIGVQDFEKIISEKLFYIDKTEFIKEWWDNSDEVTLITRPRRFGNTLTINMVERFFSNKYPNEKIFENLNIWKYKEYQSIQGTLPVVSISFADLKETNYDSMVKKICEKITECYKAHREVLDNYALLAADRKIFNEIVTKCTQD